MKRRKIIKPYPGMVIRESVVFAPGVYNFFNQKGLVISGEDIEIDGNDCVFIGGKPKKGRKDDSYSSEFSYGYGEMTDDGLGYSGIAIHMENCRRVTLHRVSARGFETGLYMTGCEECKIYENDFSYNYHNPGWGWEEHKDLGGMLLWNSHQNELWNNRATDVWSALVLRESNRNYVHHNNCSHTSNVGLRLWLSSYNRIEENNFSWGLRKEPDEVHARDSSCVLIEAASCYNVLKKNDMRYGGDGLFIRSLNNMMSVHNLFEENDASFANNNAIEAWDAYNVYIRNKANYSSYGFWLGCSDHTVLIENEVIGNGSVFRNAPEAFGNAGIAVVNGSGNDFYLEGNRIEENSGPGIAVRNKPQEPSRNWVLIRNRICRNRNDPRGYAGHGIYMKHVFGIHFIGNEISENEGEMLYRDENVAEAYLEEPDTLWEKAEILCEAGILEEKRPYRFRIDKNYPECRFYTDDGIAVRETEPVLNFDRPGRVRMRVLARDEKRLATGEKNFYVLPQGTKLPKLCEVNAWKGRNGEICRKSGRAVELSWRRETNPEFFCKIPPVSMEGQTDLVLLCHYQNDMIDPEAEVKGPVFTLKDLTGKRMRITPKKPLFAEICSRENEAKYEGALCWIPIREKEGFQIETEKGFSEEISEIGIAFEIPIESNGALKIMDARFCSKSHTEYEDTWNLQELPENLAKSAVRSSSGYIDGKVFGKVPNCFAGEGSWKSGEENGKEEWSLHFGMKRPVNAVEMGFYADGERYRIPEKTEVYAEEGQLLARIGHHGESQILVEGLDAATSGLRFCFQKPEGYQIGIWKCRVLKKASVPAENLSCGETMHLRKAIVKLNVERENAETVLHDLEYAICETNEEDILASALLERGRIKEAEIHPGKELELDFYGMELTCGKTYHLMLWQQEKAPGIQKGAYYRWVGAGIAPMDQSYGYISDLKVIDRDRTGWGRNYLKLVYDEMVWDGSNTSDGMGNRFGLAGMDKLYQKFQVPTEKKFGDYP